jgi:hypothetical protein
MGEESGQNFQFDFYKQANWQSEINKKKATPVLHDVKVKKGWDSETDDGTVVTLTFRHGVPDNIYEQEAAEQIKTTWTTELLVDDPDVRLGRSTNHTFEMTMGKLKSIGWIGARLEVQITPGKRSKLSKEGYDPGRPVLRKYEHVYGTLWVPVRKLVRVIREYRPAPTLTARQEADRAVYDPTYYTERDLTLAECVMEDEGAMGCRQRPTDDDLKQVRSRSAYLEEPSVRRHPHPYDDYTTPCGKFRTRETAEKEAAELDAYRRQRARLVEQERREEETRRRLASTRLGKFSARSGVPRVDAGGQRKPWDEDGEPVGRWTTYGPSNTVDE